MSSVLPFDIIFLIIDIIGENKDMNLLKELALVSHSFHQLCSKHIFATVELHDALPHRSLASSKKRFIRLLKNSPDVVKYIRKLTYNMEIIGSNAPLLRSVSEDRLLSPTLPNFLRTIPRLNYLKITSSGLDWARLDSSLASAFLHLMHLPTINHIDLSCFINFPLFSLTPSINLHRLDISGLLVVEPLSFFGFFDEGVSHENFQLEMMPKIREFYTSRSALMTSKLLHTKTQDGRSAFNFMDLRRLSMSYTEFEDERSVRYVLQNAKLLENLHLLVDPLDQSLLVGLHGILSKSPTARTLKVLGLTFRTNVDDYESTTPLPLPWLCEE